MIERDRVVDADYAQIFRELLACMVRDPRNVFRATRLQSIAKYLERIGDHATNLAEMVIFMVMRQDIRHRGKLGEPTEPRPPRGVLFLCVRNSARSQMAEGWARKLLPADARIFSAGSEPAETVSRHAVESMREAGVEIGSQRTKGMGEIPLAEVDVVVTLCSEEVFPVLPGSMPTGALEFARPCRGIGQRAGGEGGVPRHPRRDSPAHGDAGQAVDVKRG